MKKERRSVKSCSLLFLILFLVMGCDADKLNLDEETHVSGPVDEGASNEPVPDPVESVAEDCVDCEEEIQLSLQWLAIGQSNMAILDNFSTIDDAGARFAAPGTTEFLSITDVGDVPAVPAHFAIQMTKLESKPVSVYAGALSGTGVDCWLPPESGIESTFFLGGCWESRIEPLFGIPMDGVIWWQGEADASDKMPPSVYVSKMTEFISTLRNFLGNEDLPFILVILEEIDPQICVAAGGAPCNLVHWKEIQAAQREIAATIQNVHAIDISDITYGNSHPIESYAEIANRLANRAFEVTQ